MSEFSEDQRKFIEEVAERNDITNFEIQSKGGTIKGDNYMGVVKFITIKDNNSDKKLDLVLKTAHTNETLRKQIPLNLAYLREIYMYDTVLPQLLAFQKQYEIQQPFRGVAKMYGVLGKDGNESLLLENLRTSDHRLWNRKVPMNSDHVEIVLREYARYHAISFALRDIFPEKFESLAKNLKDIFEGNDTASEEMFKGMITNYCKKGYNALGDHPAVKSLKNFEENLADFFFKDIKTEENQHVILHGDCWCNNMLFQYEDNQNLQKPTKVCFVDWQLSKMGSPVLDLAYFICVCVDKDILLDLDKYLNIYHQSLSQNLQEFGCDPEKIFPLDMFRLHWKKFSKLGLFCAFSIMPLMLSESKDTLDMTEIVDSGKDLWAEFSSANVVADKANTFNERIFDLIVYMDEAQLI